MTTFAENWGRPRAGSLERAQWYYLGRGALAHEDWPAAQMAFTNAVAQLRESAEWSLLWLSNLGLATIAWRGEHGEAALEYLHDAYILTDRLSGGWPRVWSLWLLGHLYAGQHERVEAGACFTRARSFLPAEGEDAQEFSHLLVVAAMLCASESSEPDLLAERLFGLAQLAIRLGKQQGLPLEALEGLRRAPRLLRAATAGGGTITHGPLEWLRSVLPRTKAVASTHPAAAPLPLPPLETGEVTAAEGGGVPDMRAYCLGRFEVWVGHTLVTQWASTKSKTLLKILLAAYPAMVPATSLMNILWGGVEEELARQRLHTAISDLRRALKAVRPDAGAFIVSQNGSYGLDERVTVWIDIAEFGRFQSAGVHYEQAGRFEEAKAALREAAALYRGEYLAEDLYEDWPIDQRERLKSEYLVLLARLCQATFEEGDYLGCAGWGQLMLECDACREDAHRLLMRCYSRLGQRALALRQYRQCADALRRDLDAIPEGETEELYRRLQQGQEL